MATIMWTTDSMQDAQERQEFIHVGPVENPRVTIMDASGMWKWDPSILFHTGYRIAGTERQIVAALEEAGVEDEDVDEVLATAITSTNYEDDFEEVMAEEIAAFENWRRSAVQANLDAPGLKLYDMMVRLNLTMAAKPKGRTTRRSPGKGKGGSGLYKRLQSLPYGKVLNVTGLKEDGKGARMVNTPGAKSKMIGVADLEKFPLVSSNLEGYLRALSMFPGGEAAYADQAAEMRQRFAGAGTAARVLKATPPTRARAPIPATRLTANPPTGFEAYRAPPPAADLERKPVAPMFTAGQRRQRQAQTAVAPTAIPQRRTPVGTRTPTPPTGARPPARIGAFPRIPNLTRTAPKEEEDDGLPPAEEEDEDSDFEENEEDVVDEDEDVESEEDEDEDDEPVARFHT